MIASLDGGKINGHDDSGNSLGVSDSNLGFMGVDPAAPGKDSKP
jgi:hypothetical protein